MKGHFCCWCCLSSFRKWCKYQGVNFIDHYDAIQSNTVWWFVRVWVQWNSLTLLRWSSRVLNAVKQWYKLVYADVVQLKTTNPTPNNSINSSSKQLKLNLISTQFAK